MTSTDFTLQLLDRESNHYANAILVAHTGADTQAAMACEALAGRMAAAVRNHRDGYTKDASWTVDGVIKRLQKVSLRPSVQHDPVAADNIRLAIRALRTLTEPALADSDPIDIFIFNS